MWVLIDCDMTCYFFKEGYLRTSCKEFSNSDVKDIYVHLTNNAIQKHAEDYGRYEDGNQLSFDSFQEYIDSRDDIPKTDFKKSTLPRIKEMIVTSLKAAQNKLNPYDRSFCFEIFGYDFMIDGDMNPWLIEVNTNPCIEESSQLLKDLIPRMLDDAMKLTVDRIFDKPGRNKTALSQSRKGDRSGLARTMGEKSSVLKEKSSTQKMTTGQHSDSNLHDLKTTTINLCDLQPSMTVDGVVVSEGQDMSDVRELSSPEIKPTNGIYTWSFPVKGYEDSENMWQKITTLKHRVVSKTPYK